MSRIMDWLAGALDKAKKAAAAATGELGKVDDILLQQITGVNNFVISAVSLLLPGIVEAIPDGMDKFLDHMKDRFEKGLSPVAPTAYNYLRDMGLIDQAGIDLLDKATAPFGAFKPIINLIFVVMTVLNYITSIQAATTGKIMQKYNSAFAPNTIDTGSAVRLAAIAPELYGKAHDILRKNGLDNEDIQALFISAYRLYDETTVRDLFLRGELTEDKARERLREMQYTDGRIDEMRKLWQVIPPIQDIITMSVREVFSPAKRASLGLDADFPEAVKEWAAKQGLSMEWAGNYWAMHWVLPSAQMGFEMLHRGEITEDELDELLIALDYAPRWHKPLKAIAYNVMTRVDARRLFELGILTPEALLKKYQEMGYNKEDAAALVKWTEIEYNQEAKDVTKTELLSLYLEGFIERGELYSQLTALGYKSERIDSLVELASYKRAFAGQKSFIETLKRLYVAGEATEQNVQTELAVYNIDARRVTEMIDQWDLERRASVKLPTKADVDEWLSASIITETEYRQELARLGYNERYIGMYVRAIQAKKAGG